VLNNDYYEMLQTLSEHKVKFIVVGAYALGVHGYPRATGDIDIWVANDSGNSRSVFNALAAFGSPVANISGDTFSEPNITFQIGVAPRRIDIITSISGVSFNDAYVAREEVEVDGLIIPFLSKTHLIQNKEATGRKKDKLDVEYLKKT